MAHNRPNFTRRNTIAGLVALATHAAIPGAWSLSALSSVARTRLPFDPFTLGVASGPGIDGGLVLWTKLAPEITTQLAQLSGLSPKQYLSARAHVSSEPQRRISVLWELSDDASFGRIVRRGQTMALPELGHSVHVEIPAAALVPGRWYWYRFLLGDATSTIGRTATLPDFGDAPSSFRFALASCQHYEHGYFGAYAHMRADDPHAVLFVGDYLYEGGPSKDRFRAHPFPSARTLFDYRLRHALYKQDPDLQRMHAHCPWWLTWDDHEVSNDYAGDYGGSKNVDAAARKQAAYQAYYEHMPLPVAAFSARSKELRIYRQLSLGKLAQVYLIDNRQYRDRQACSPPGRAQGRILHVERCAERLDPQRTLLGQAQMAWLQNRFTQSHATWNLLGQQTLFAPVAHEIPQQRFWSDGWDGYPAERNRIRAAMRTSGLSNPVILGGDVHSNWVCDVPVDDTRTNAMATEFCCTSITSASKWREGRLAKVVASNKHVHFANARYRGYTLGTLTPQTLTVTLRAMDDVRKTQPRAHDLARFVVLNGKAGAQRVS